MKGHNWGLCRKCKKRHELSAETRKQLSISRSGSGNSHWKGGKMIVGGYRYIWYPTHPNRTQDGYVLEHRLVVESKINRILQHGEVVHHKDGNRLNNDLSNLELLKSTGKHYANKHSKRNAIGQFS